VSEIPDILREKAETVWQWCWFNQKCIEWQGIAYGKQIVSSSATVMRPD
jgi:hypothetical protein